MSEKEPVVIEQPAYTPIDPTTYKWEPGKQVRNQVNLVAVFGKDGKHFFALDCNWFSFPEAFTLNVVKPLTFDDLDKLVKEAISGFVKDNDMMKGRDDAEKKVLVKDLFGKLFTYWYAELLPIGLIDVESFKQAQAKTKNGNGKS